MCGRILGGGPFCIIQFDCVTVQLGRVLTKLNIYMIYLLDLQVVFAEPNSRTFTSCSSIIIFFSGLFSVVTMELEQKKDNTVLKLSQSGVPDYDTKRTEEGWKRHFWGPIKQVFGYGAQLF